MAVFVGGDRPAADKLYVTAYDGKAWSAQASLNATAIARPSEDFKGDACSDILWHSEGGSVVMWQMNGSRIVSNTTVGPMSAAWTAEGTKNFSGDLRADILWQRDNGAVQIWKMNSDQVLAKTTIGKMGSSWYVATVEDLNGDGRAEILQRL